MDYFKIIILYFFSSNVFANSWVAEWVDGPATATYERTSSYLRTYVDMPKTGGHAQYTLNSTPPSTGSGNHFSGASTASTAKIATNVSIPVGSSAGSAVKATLTATIPKINLAAASVSMVRVLPAVSTALSLAWLANAGYNYLQETDEFTQSPSSTASTNIVYQGANIFQGGYLSDSSSPSDACQASCASTGQCNGTSTATNTVSPPSINGTCTTPPGFSWTPSYRAVQTNTCPQNYTYPGSGTLCNLIPGTSGTPVSPETVATDIADHPISGSSDSAQMFDDLLAETIKNNFRPATDGQTPQLTGPTAPIQGPVSTTTAPDGTVTQKSTTYTPSFNDNHVDTTENTVTTVTDNSNTTTTTTTGPANTETTLDIKTDCDKYPESVGCSEYGDIPEPDAISEIDVPITLSPDSWGSGSCPADKSLGLSVGSFSWSYQPVCNFMTGVYPVVIAIGWLLAGFIVMSSIRD